MMGNNPIEHDLQVVIFRLQTDEFGVDVNYVQEIIRMVDITHIPHAPGFIVGVINLHGQIIPVIDLARQFDLPFAENPVKNARMIIVETGRIIAGLIVDEAPEVMRLSAESIELPPELLQSKIKSDYILGIGKTAQRLIVLLDLGKLMAPHERDIIAQSGKENNDG